MLTFYDYIKVEKSIMHTILHQEKTMVYIEDNDEIRKELLDILNKMNIPLIDHLDEDALIDFIKNDKKAKGNSIDIILVDEIGKALIKKVKIDDLRCYLGRKL